MQSMQPCIGVREGIEKKKAFLMHDVDMTKIREEL